MTRSVANSTVQRPALRTLDCGHVLTFAMSPPPVGEIVLCPSCRIDDPPRQVVKGERARP